MARRFTLSAKTRNLGIFLLQILTFLIWSNSFIAIKVLLARMDAFDLLRLRFIPVAIISASIVMLFYRGSAWQIIKAHPVRVTLGGLLMVISYNLFLNSGMKYVQPNAASLLIALNPLITLLLAVRFLREPFTRRRLLGTIVTFIGLAIGSFPLLFLIDRPFIEKTLSLRPLEYGAAAFLSLACTILAYTFWNIAVKHWRASNVSLFVYLNPPLTAIFTYLFFGIGITFYFLAGGAIMLTGIILATYKVRSSKFEAEERCNNFTWGRSPVTALLNFQWVVFIKSPGNSAILNWQFNSGNHIIKCK